VTPVIAAFQIGPWANEYPTRMLALIIGFVLILLFLWKVNMPIFSWPYVSGLLKERTARIQENHEQVERALADARQLRDDYAARLRTIEEEARQRIDAAVREAEAVQTEIVAEARESALALQRRSEEEIDRERTRQRILLRRQIVQISLDAAEQSVVSLSNDRVQHQLIQDFITRAGSETPAATTATGTEA
jgi:F-type H+-transporting ATPase subunit b